MGDKHIFRSDRQSSGNFLLAADPQGGRSPEPVITAAGRCTVESVTGSLKEMSGSKLVYAIYFQKGEMKTPILMVAILMTLRKTDSVKAKGMHTEPVGGADREVRSRPAAANWCQKCDYLNKLGHNICLPIWVTHTAPFLHHGGASGSVTSSS